MKPLCMEETNGTNQKDNEGVCLARGGGAAMHAPCYTCRRAERVGTGATRRY